MSDLYEGMLEVHIDWMVELRRRMRMNYQDVDEFATANNLNHLEVFWFFKGCPVPSETFKSICENLDCDWEKVQEAIAA